MGHFDNDLENNAQILEHNVEKFEEILNRIMQIVSIIIPQPYSDYHQIKISK